MTDTPDQQSPAAAEAAAGPSPATTTAAGAPSSGAPQRPPRSGAPCGNRAHRPSRPAATAPARRLGKLQLAAIGVTVALMTIGAVQAGVPIGAVIAVLVVGAVIAGIVFLIRRAVAKRRVAQASGRGGAGGGGGKGPRGSGGSAGRRSLRDRIAAGVPGMKPRGSNPGGKGPGGRGPKGGGPNGTGPKGGCDRKGLARFLPNRKNKDKPGTDGAARSGGLPPTKPGGKKNRNLFRRNDKNGSTGTAPRGKHPSGAPGSTGGSRNPFRRNKNGAAGTGPFKSSNKPGAGTGASNLVSRATEASWKQWRTGRAKAKADRIKSGNTRPRVAWRATKKGTAAGLIGAATVAGWGWRSGKVTGRAASRGGTRVASWWSRRAGTATGPTIDAEYMTTGTSSTGTGAPPPPSSPKPAAGALGGARYEQTAYTPVPSTKPPKASRVFTPAAPADHQPYRTATTTSKGTTRMSHHATQGTVEAASQMASYQPKNLLDIVGMSHAAPGAIASLSQAFTNLASGLEGTPAAASADAYRQVSAQLAAAASAAAETGAMLETAHTADLNRIRNPRPNESMADFSHNQS